MVKEKEQQIKIKEYREMYIQVITERGREGTETLSNEKELYRGGCYCRLICRLYAASFLAAAFLGAAAFFGAATFLAPAAVFY